MATINTGKVEQRRKLRFDSLDEISVDVERLAAAKELNVLGNWSAGQVFKHLAIVMHGAIDGLNIQPPWMMRIALPILLLFMKSRFLTKSMPAGIQLPSEAAKVLQPSACSITEGLDAIRTGLARLKSDSHREVHPFLGKLSNDEWDMLQCRHCELHLSFLVPVDV